MTQSAELTAEDTKEEKLPLRDWIILPLLSLLTICLIVASVAFVARRTFSEPQASSLLDCFGPADPKTGSRAIPNTVCWDKVLEGPLVEYRFNSCGDRAGMECAPKPVGTYRIVMIGSSVAQGGGVEQDKTFAALLPAYLSRETGRRIDLYNKGNYTIHPFVAAQRMPEVLAAHPDSILWVLTPFDVEKELPDNAPRNPQRDRAGLLAKAWFRVHAITSAKSIPDALRDAWQMKLSEIETTPPATMLLHILYKNRNQYLKSSLAAGDPSGFLLAQPSERWQTRLKNFENDDIEIERQARAAGVPLLVTLVPSRAQAALISMGEWPAGYDPYKLGEEVHTIIARHGGTYIDILPEYQNTTNPENGYFPVDGHPNADGNALIARMLVRELTNGSVPALRARAEPNVGLRQSK